MLTAYLAERVPLRTFVPVAAALAWASRAARWPGAGDLAAGTALSFLLVLQFRMWDDLADRHVDAVRRPDRVLAGAGSPTPVAAAAVAAGLINLTCAAMPGRGPRAALALLGLNAAMALLYRLRSTRTAAGDHLLLAKYPAFVVILAHERTLAASPWRLSLACAAVYLAACLYEAWHDRSAPAARRPALLASEGVLLACAIGLLSLGGDS